MTSNNTDVGRIKLSELANVISPKRMQQSNMSGNTPYVNIEYLEKGTCDRYVQKKSNVYADDIIIVADGYRSGMVFKGKEGWLGSTLRAIRINPDSNISSQYLYYYLSFLTLDRDGFQYGTTIRHLDIALLKDIQILVPSTDQQQEICNKISTLEEKRNNIRRCIFKIERLLESISYKEKKSILKNNKSIISILDTVWEERLKSVFTQLQ